MYTGFVREKILSGWKFSRGNVCGNFLRGMSGQISGEGGLFGEGNFFSGKCDLGHQVNTHRQTDRQVLNGYIQAKPATLKQIL